MGLLDRIFSSGKPAVMPVHLNDDNFEAEVLRHDGLVLVDIWGPGCAPCKQLEPIIIRLAKDYAGRLKVAEINAAGAPRTMAKLGVRGTPTVLYYRNGKVVDQVVGFRGSLWHRQTIDHLLGDDTPQAGGA